MPSIQSLHFNASLRLNVFQAALRAMRRLAIRGGRVAQIAPHLEMGEQGELAALFHLRRLGYVIVARRWRTPKQRGDIDLIAWEADTLCFIEVKTRAAGSLVSAEAAVDEDKRKVLRRMARHYVRTIEPPPDSVRFDLVSVYFGNGRPEFTVFRWAFA